MTSHSNLLPSINVSQAQIRPSYR